MQINVDKNGQELVARVDHEFPIKGRIMNISDYEDSHFIHHWHKEPEFTVILKGELYYQVNEKIFHLKEGQGIFVNSNAIHSGWNRNAECLYLPINFAHWLLFDTENSIIFKKYIEPVVLSEVLPCVLIEPDNAENSKILSLLIDIGKETKNQNNGYELKAMSMLCEILGIIMPKALNIIESKKSNVTPNRSIARIKKAIDYIDAHYAEEITLKRLAELTNLSSSEFCRSFKAIMRHTPMEYISNTRIRKSLPLLVKQEHSITKIAEMCGFSGASYYAEMFKKYMMCSPTQYIKTKQGGVVNDAIR